MYGGWGSASALGVTVAETVYSDLWKFDLDECPDSCNGRGQCFFGYCYCAPGYFGEDCQNSYCKSTTCMYQLASQLQQCTHCNGHGICVAGDCLCSEGFKTPDNYEATFIDDNATLVDNKACTIGHCPRNCNGHGICALTKGNNCTFRYLSLFYIFYSCVFIVLFANTFPFFLCVCGYLCSFRFFIIMSIIAGVYACACNDGWSGRDCSQAYCSSTCNYPYGACNFETATCECSSTPLGKYTGSECLKCKSFPFFFFVSSHCSCNVICFSLLILVFMDSSVSN
jgi:hypothetical protein